MTRRIQVLLLLASIGLVLAGVLLGPLYVCYCAFLSGTEAERYELRVGEPAAVRLAPEMNPLHLRVTYEYVRKIPQPTSRLNIYEGELLAGEQRLWSDRISLSLEQDSEPTVRRWDSPETSTMTHVIGPLWIAANQGHTFLIRAGNEPQIEVRRITLAARRNVATINVPLAVFGCLLIPLGVGGILVTAFAMFKRV